MEPLWRRIQVTSLLSTSAVTDWRSSSDRWAVEMIAQRGLPDGERSIAPASTGSPSIHWAKLGAASTPLSRMAKAVRSAGG